MSNFSQIATITNKKSIPNIIKFWSLLQQVVVIAIAFCLISLGIAGESPALTTTSPLKPEIFDVTSSLDNSAAGTLRWAINQANLTQQQAIIDLTKITAPIKINRSLPTISTDMIIKGHQDTVISGNNRYRIFHIKKGNVTLTNLQIRNGLAQGEPGQRGAGGAAGMGGGLLMEGGKVNLANVIFANNKAIGGEGSNLPINEPENPQIINQIGGRFYVNRGAIAGANGISLGGSDPQKINLDHININTDGGEFLANRGAVAGVNGIGISGIGAITFGGGGGFGGFGNAGNGGNGGNGGFNGGNGGNGGDGGNGGIGFFGSFGTIDGTGTIGNISFGGGGGFGGFGNAGNGGNGGNICAATDTSSQSNPSYGYEDNDSESESFLDDNLDQLFEEEDESITEEKQIQDNNNLDQADINSESEPETPLNLLYCGNGGNGGNGGDGGFGGGGGSGGFGGNGSILGQPGMPGKGGFGGGNGGKGFGGAGAGFGGAIFIKSGTLILENTSFVGNIALGGKGIQPGLGKGGAIFIVTEDLASQVEVAEVAQVIAKNSLPSFQGNIAQNAKNLPIDNQDIFGVITIQNSAKVISRNDNYD